MRMFTFIWTIVLFTFLSEFKVSAQTGGGIGLYEAGTPGVGYAYAGNAAVAEDASTAFYNPAGMTRIDGNQLVGGLQGYVGNLRFDTSSKSTSSGDNGGNAFQNAAGIGLYTVYSATTNLKFGLTVNAPVGLGLDFGDDWAGRYFVQEVSLLVLNVEPSMAVKVNDHWSFGVAPLIMYGQEEVEAAINNGVDALPDGKLRLKDLDDTAVGFKLGTMYELNEKTRFGINYRSPMHMTLDGDIKARAAGPSFPVGIATSADLNLDLPQHLNVSYFQTLTERWNLLMDVQWSDWSDMSKVPFSVGQRGEKLDTHWKDTYRGAIGAQYQLNEKWQFTGGFAYESSAVEDKHRLAVLLTDQQFRYSLGANYQIKEDLRLGLGYTFIDLGKNEIRQSNATGDVLDGDFSPARWLHIIALSATWDF